MKLKIGKKTIGDGHPTFIIAELSANHGQKYSIAAQTIRAAAKAGADAIKLQTYTADTITMKSDKKYFRIGGGTLWDGRTLHDLYQEAYTPWHWQPKLKKLANRLGLECFSSPFDPTAVDFLEKMRVPAYKIASFEITDIPLIEYVASKKKPIIISTGIATMLDIRAAIKACHRVGNHQIALLKCTSSYPAKIEDANLATIPDMQKKFGIMAGLSDHTTGIVSPVVATTLGAHIIEKHMILDHKLGGPDAAFSLDPHEFTEMVQAVRDAEKAIGKATYSPKGSSKKNRVFGRSLFAVQDIQKGERFTRENIRSIRPHHGLPTYEIKRILNKTAARNIEAGTPLSWSLINRS